MRTFHFLAISRLTQWLSLVAALAACSATVWAQAWQVPTGLPTGVGAAGMLTTSGGDVYYSAVTSTSGPPTYIADYSTAIYKSVDGGVTFAATATGLGSPGFGSLDVFEEISGELWFGGKAGYTHSSDWFFRSTDGGTTWTSTGTGQDVRPIEFAADGGAFYAYTASDGVWQSLDSGVTWTDFNYSRNDFPRYQTINGRRYYREHGALKVSDNGGVTKTLATATIGVPGEVVEFGGSIYCYSLFKPYYRSADNGDTWETIANLPGHPDLKIKNMFTVGGRLFVTTSNEFYGGANPLLFTDDGDHWAELKLPGQPVLMQKSGISGSHLVALNGTGLSTLDLGPFSGPPVILMAPQSSDAPMGAPFTVSVYATGAAPATYQWYRGASGDTSQPIAGAVHAEYTIPTITGSGNYWARVTNSAGSIDSPAASLHAVEIWTDQGPAVVAGSRNFYGPVSTPGVLRVMEASSGKVYASTDGGTTWDGGVVGPVGANLYLFGSLYPLVYSDGVFLSSRAGSPSDSNANLAISTDFVNWTELADFNFYSNPSQIIKNGSEVYISDNGAGFARSTDGGATFSLSNNGLGASSTIYLVDLIRTDSGVLIASRNAVSAQTVVTSSDNGLTWSPRAFKTGTYVLASDLHYANGTAYATVSNAEKGLWKSTNDGVTWTRIALAGQALESVTVTDGKIIVSAPGKKPSVWISEDAGVTFNLLTNTGLDGIDPGKLIGHENYVFFQNPNGDSSRLLRLRIGTPTGEPVAIVTEPLDAVASATISANLTVEVSGTGPFTYQWFRGASGIGVPVGTNSPSYTTDPAVFGDTSYYVEISNGFGPPTRSRNAQISYLFGPRLTFEFRDKAYFEGTTPTFGPSFFQTTPPDTDYQWYRGESGDTSAPVAGGTAAMIGPPLVTSGDRIWLRATANGITVDSAAGSISAVAWSAGNMDVISRDPSGQTWTPTLPNLSEDGRYAFIGAWIRLPYSTPEYFSGFTRGDDISNTGRFILTHADEVYDRASETLTPGVSGAFQIGRSGRYLLVNGHENDQIPPGSGDGSKYFIYDRVNSTYRGISRPQAGVTPSYHDTQVLVEMDANEESVFFSNFAGGNLIAGETSTMYIYDIATDSISVPPPLRGKGSFATFLDASSNGRFLLFSWNAQIENFRPSELRDDGNVRPFTYLYDRELEVVSYIETPIGIMGGDISVSNDGNIISFHEVFGINNTALWVTARTPGTDVWATKRLLDIPEVSDYAANLRMSDDGSTFLFSTLRWNQLKPGYLPIGSFPTNELNVMAITGFRVGTSTPAPTFADYAASAFAAYPPELRGSAADADGNGISNWFEFLSGRAPAGPSRALIDLGTRDGVATISFRQRTDTPAIFTPEFSADLGISGPWIDISDREMDRVEIEPGVWEITVRSPLGALVDAQFFRLKAPLPAK